MRLAFILPAAALVLGGISAGAQRASAQTGKPEAKADAQTGADAKVLNRLHKADQMEIELGELAIQRAQSPKVKDYAHRIVKDHKSIDREVTQVAKQEKITLTPATKEEPKEGAEPGTETATGSSAHGSALERLRGLKGADFDRAYVSTMRAEHEQDIEDLKRARGEVSSPKTKALIDKTIPILERHLKMANELASTLQPAG